MVVPVAFEQGHGVGESCKDDEMKREKVESWLEATLPGDTLRAYLLGGPVNGGTMDGSDSGLPSSRHPADLDAHLAVATVGGHFGARPKHLLHTAPRGEFRCEWWVNDVTERLAATYCNVLCFFSDGSWAALVEPFVAALGPDGHQIDWRDPST